MRHRGALGLVVVVWGAGAVSATSANAGTRGAQPDCFDALVSASIVRQIPTVIPDCGNDCIIMSWPWVIELDIERVIRGKAPGNTLEVLTVQHTYYRTDLGARRWWLRRNSLSGFNVIEPNEKVRLRRCPEGSPPVQPYIQPGAGQTLHQLVREGEDRYGKVP